MPLAVKHRPKTLESVFGQDHITLVLATMLGRYYSGEIDLPPGFVLTGPHGLGKTTTARIVAAALNCRALPCGSCQTCRAVFSGRSDSVIELDGATAGSVDRIRELIHLARTAHSGVYRVFIIDECQSLSEPAWHALLKQLEEPPPQVLYVLVTTDINKVPRTVQSRAFLLAFRSLDEQAIIAGMERVLALEHYDGIIEPAALHYLASLAGGALRDAIMHLEQLVILQDVSLARAQQLWPDVPLTFAREFFETAAALDVQAGTEVIARAFNHTRDLGALFRALQQLLHQQAYTARGSDIARQIADLIVVLWEHQRSLDMLTVHDVTPLIALWYHYAKLLTPAVSTQHPLAVLSSGQPEPDVACSQPPRTAAPDSGVEALRRYT